MKKIHINRKLFRLHAWLGLFLGILYFLISVGGASIVFYPELNQLLYGNKIKVVPENKPLLTYDELYRKALKDYPQSMYISISHDLAYPGNAYSLVTGDPSTTALFENGTARIDYVNPYNGNVVFKANSGGSGDILGILNSLHVALYLGTGGAFIVALMSVAVLISLITGFIFYRKNIIRVLTFKAKVKFKNWRTASSDLHRVIGTWAFFFNILIFGSGLYMEYVLLTPGWWKENWPPVMQKTVTTPPDISIQALIDTAVKKIPDMQISAITVIKDTSETISISGLSRQKLFLDIDNYQSVDFKFNGEIKTIYNKKWSDLSGLEKFQNINFYIFHTGWAFGIPGKIIWTIMGFAPAILSITGFLLWWRRKKKPAPPIYQKS